jgi:homoserine kinase
VLALSNNVERVVVAKTNFPESIRLVIVTPSITVPTHQAREVLPNKYDRADVLHTLQRTSLLAATCFSGNFDLFPELFQDKLHQPYRQQLVPGMEKCLGLRLPGLLGVAISGSGSSVIAFTTGDEMRVAEELQRIFTSEGVQTEATFTLADNNGAGVTRELIPLMERIGAVLQKLEKS